MAEYWVLDEVKSHLIVTLIERKQNREGVIIKTNQRLFTVFYPRFISTVMMSYESSFFSPFWKISDIYTEQCSLMWLIHENKFEKGRFAITTLKIGIFSIFLS